MESRTSCPHCGAPLDPTGRCPTCPPQQNTPANGNGVPHRPYHDDDSGDIEPVRRPEAAPLSVVFATQLGMLRRVAAFFRKRFGGCKRTGITVALGLLLVTALGLLLLRPGSGTPDAPDARLAADGRLALATAIDFLEIARKSPAEAFSRHGRTAATERFKQIGERLWQTVSAELGWRWFFQGCLAGMAAPTPTGTPVCFYHPWSDTVLVTVWNVSNKVARIGDCEILMGDVLRSRGTAKSATTRAWARRRQYFAAAIGQITAESLRSIELLSAVSNSSVTNAGATNAATARVATNAASSNALPQIVPATGAASWRANFRTMLPVSNLEANHYGAGVMLLAAISDITRFTAPTNVFAIRVVPTLQQLHSPTNTITIAPEALATIRLLPDDFMSRFMPAFYANSRKRAFLMLQSRTDPKKCLSFLFKLEPPEDKEGKETPEDDKKAAEARKRQIMALTNLEMAGTNDSPDEMYPEAFYPIKLIRADLVDLHAVYTNLYPEKTEAKK